MDVQVVAQALRENFIGFKGSETELLRELFAHSNPGSLRDVPSSPRAFRFALKTIAPELLTFGVSVTVFETGMCHVKSASEAQKESGEESSLRAFFNGSSPESAALRSEFVYFERYAAYRRGLNSGQIHPPRRGRPVESSAGNASVDPRPLEQQLQERWNREPATRAAYSSFEAFSAFERANAKGQVHRFGF